MTSKQWRVITIEGPFELDGCTDSINIYDTIWNEWLAACGGVL
jgi:hypothetical protein